MLQFNFITECRILGKYKNKYSEIMYNIANKKPKPQRWIMKNKAKHLHGFGSFIITIVVRLPKSEPRSIDSCCVWQRDINEKNVCGLSEVELVYQVPSDATIDRILKQNRMWPLWGTWNKGKEMAKQQSLWGRVPCGWSYECRFPKWKQLVKNGIGTQKETKPELDTDCSS